MKFSTSHLVHTLLGIGVVGAVVIAGQPADKHGDKSPPGAPHAGGMDMEKAMADWMALTKPGAPHAMLKKLEGEYTTVSRMWMDPSGAPMESKGKASLKSILGGRFIQQAYDGQMMGMPHSGMGLLGYDNYRHQYVSMWVDSMNTNILTMSGGISRDGKVLTMFGTMDEPTTKEIGKTVKWVWRLTGDDTFSFEAWEVQYGTPFMVVEVVYTRVK